MTYRVKLPVFEGPFDLLLHLVKENQMDIYDVEIAKITEQYLEYIEAAEKLNVELAGEFLVMAATLINIKSRALMPTPTEEETGEGAEDEITSTRALIEQLIEYRRFKEAAQTLAEREQEHSRVFYRSRIIPIVAPEADAQVMENLEALFSAFSRVLRYATSEDFHRVIEERFRVEDKIADIEHRLRHERTLSLRALFSRCINKIESIVTFLALLELCRQRRIRLVQKKQFDDVVASAVAG
ncbi:segregation/condensation protein A [Candidatus Sumerlaeota bacterium]|nr:segregation/condensation protein A [Candidatus Sumerlaeota bacterium]